MFDFMISLWLKITTILQFCYSYISVDLVLQY